MYCRECGAKLNKGARFCNACGKKVEVEAAESDSLISPKKKKKGGIIAAGIVAVFLILGILLVSLVVFGGADKIRVARLCNLGDRYLSELKYEQAIAAYEAAIEIDPKAEEAYIGLADAYIGLGDYESAVEVLERGINETKSERLKDYCDDIQKEWDDKERRICGTVFLVGTDLNDSNNASIPRVCVSLTDQRGETTTYYTDENGYYDTGKLSAGTYFLYFTVDGYVDYQCEVDLNGGRNELDVYLELENSSVVLSPGRYMIDIPEGYSIDLQAETTAVVSTYTMERRNGNTEYLGYKETYNPGDSLAWQCGKASNLTYLTIYSGTVQATGTYNYQTYDALDELGWYSETDIEGVFGIEITKGKTITIENQNFDGWDPYYCGVRYFVKGSDDLIGYNTTTDYWWEKQWSRLGYSNHDETVNTYELHKGESHYSFLNSCNRVEYTVTQGSMVWYTEYTNKDLLTISFEGAAEPDIPSDAYELDTEDFQMAPPVTFVPWSEAGLEDHVMDWQDEHLEAAMREITGINDRDIMLSDVWELTELEWELDNISNISALSGLTNLVWLNLRGNKISDISALRSLTNLEYLHLDSNQIKDISALRGLTNLTRLELGYNQISDISALSGLTNLTELYLHWNQISDISILSGLINLTGLYLGSNQISDISALSDLTNLKKLYLGYNQISDISALSGLTNLTELELGGNQISH